MKNTPYFRYRREMREARTRLSVGSQVVHLASGPVEYAEIGSGYPVLVIHGAGGGYDQGIFLARTFVGNCFRWIIPSRFGYLRTPIPPDASPRVQAEAYAELLDYLDIPQAAIMGTSDGGPSTLQFVLRYPGRVTSLVMIAAKSHTPPRESLLQKAVFSMIFRSDFLYWLTTNYLKTFLIKMFGVSPEIQTGFSHGDEELVNDLIRNMHPISLRKKGIYNDRACLSELSLNKYALRSIKTPSLVIHAADDSLQPLSHGSNTARNIEGSQFLVFDTGGHFLIGHQHDVRVKVNDFIKRTMPIAENRIAV